MNHYEEIKRLLPLLPHKFQVQFALYCAKDVFQHIPKKNQEVIQTMIDLVQDWLNGKTVSNQEFNAAAHVAYAAAYAANAAAHAANAAIYEKYYNELFRIIKEITDLEKVLYKLEGL